MTPYDISPIDDTEAVRISVRGDVDFETVDAIHRDLAPEGRFLHTRRMWDLRGARLVLSPEELKQFAAMATKYDHEPARAVVLADSDLEFGLLRVHGVYRESSFTELHICRDEAEAIAWLLEESDEE